MSSKIQKGNITWICQLRDAVVWLTPFQVRFSIANGYLVLKDQVTRPNQMGHNRSPLAKGSRFQANGEVSTEI